MSGFHSLALAATRLLLPSSHSHFMPLARNKIGGWKPPLLRTGFPRVGGFQPPSKSALAAGAKLAFR